MRLLAIGDIHGCSDALLTLMKFVRLAPDDTLITLGDYVNRGPDSNAVLDWLIHHYKAGQLVPLKGNHEMMMQSARHDDHAFQNWLAVGGYQTLDSYAPAKEEGRLCDIPDSHWEFLEHDLLDYYETDRHLFVHANLLPDAAISDQPEYMLFWESIDQWAPAHESGKMMICGHTSQKSGLPLNLGHAVCIDTGACKEEGWLTCLDVETGYYWQANQQGETREAFLEPPEYSDDD